jgi:foldase protein PrsA
MELRSSRFVFDYWPACLASALLVVSISFLASAQEDGKNSDPIIAAVVTGEKITAGQVDRVLSQTVGDLNLSPDQRKRAQSAVLEKLVNQKVVFDFLEQHQAAVGEDEVRLKLEDLKTQLATVEKTIDDYLKQTGRTLDELNFEFAWQASWPPYLEKKLTDEVLKDYFDQHRRKFDGTEIRVAHLLLKPVGAERDSSRQEIEKLKQSASEIRSSLAANGLTWETAVTEHSAAPTRDAGGEIGWIKIDGPMPKVFTGAAFKLAVGELSGPVETVFGVHLIKCLEVKKGKLGWRDAIEAVKQAASRSYFDSIVEKHRPKITIEYGESFRSKN